jgi:hypothetical protein
MEVEIFGVGHRIAKPSFLNSVKCTRMKVGSGMSI